MVREAYGIHLFFLAASFSPLHHLLGFVLFFWTWASSDNQLQETKYVYFYCIQWHFLCITVYSLVLRNKETGLEPLLCLPEEFLRADNSGPQAQLCSCKHRDLRNTNFNFPSAESFEKYCNTKLKKPQENFIKTSVIRTKITNRRGTGKEQKGFIIWDIILSLPPYWENRCDRSSGKICIWGH